MQESWSDLTVAYLIAAGAVIGLPMIFFVITFLPGLMRTTGEVIGTDQSQKKMFEADSLQVSSDQVPAQQHVGEMAQQERGRNYASSDLASTD